MLTDLRVENLLKQRPDFTLSADFSMKVGERMALTGRSGSGKTTLLRILAGLEPLHKPDTGRIFFGEREVTRVPAHKRDVGFVFQNQALFTRMNVLQNVMFGLRMRGVPRKESEAQALVWLNRVRLQDRRNSSVEHLSGGERQRIALIRALVWQPRVLLLDEPFSSLDLESKMLLRDEVLKLHEYWPAPLILVSHDETDVQALCTSRYQITWGSSRRLEASRSL